MNSRLRWQQGEQLSTVGEFGVIAKLAAVLPPSPLGPGDDCAVLPALAESLIVTTDALVEGRHFRLDWSTPEDVGWKAMAVNLSDIAAMGGTPRYATCSLQLPESISVSAIQSLYDGLLAQASIFDVKVVGGNITAATELSISVTLLGTLPGKPLLRSGVRPGDDLWVSGVIGTAGAGLAELSARSTSIASDSAAVLRQLRPQPRIGLGLSLHPVATAAIDISDGLLQDLSHLAAASGVSLRIDLSAIRSCPQLPLVEAITSGEDYELAWTAPVSQRSSILALSSPDVPLSLIGYAYEGNGLWISQDTTVLSEVPLSSVTEAGSETTSSTGALSSARRAEQFISVEQWLSAQGKKQTGFSHF